MPAFEYTALDAKGKTRKGIMEGGDAAYIRSRLRELSLAPVSVDEVKEKKGTGSALTFSARGQRVPPGDLTLAVRQLATLVQAATPLEESLAVVARQTERRSLASILMAVRSRVLEGHSLAASLEGFPKVFNDLFRETVSAGEQSGQLDQVLERLAQHLEVGQHLRQKVMLAMLYPAIVMVFALLVTGAMLTFVVPQVVQVFDDFHQQLPWLTRVLIAWSNFLREFGLAALLIMALGLWFLAFLLTRPGPRLIWHRFLLKLPLISRLVRGSNTARFARTLAILTASGVPALEGLRIAGRVVDHVPMRLALEEVVVKVREGGSIHQALQVSGLFSPMVVHLIASGEASGNLAGMLDQGAKIQEREVETLVTALAGILEPLLILFMGGLVLTIVVAILLPVFDLNQLIK
ncbi:MAG: type II secretion system inner membrane protein GspF [Magnetococcales bacterium]|nr:type II secretion system inner membrane protein GspF [Magnetococcales bacterium]